MENNTSSSYPDSNASTPRSRDHPHHQDDNNNNNNNNYKVKLMCSYGGKILPRPHDHLLTYIGGDTKILSVDRHVTFLHLLHKLHLISSSSSSSICFKYQLPGEDLDALISVTNDEDLEHMMSEYDRIHKASVKPVRLRLFLFAFNSDVTNTILTSADDDDKQQWFVDALNAVQISGSEASPASENTPDYLFGFDKAVKPQPGPGSECGSEDSNSNSNSNSNNVNNNNRVVEMQNHQQQQMQVNMDPRAYYGDYYTKIHAAGPGQPQPRYWQDQQRHMTTGGYPLSVAGTDSPVYLVPASAGVYPSAPVTAAAAAPPVQAQAPAVMTMRPAAPPQAYYGMQRLVNNTSEQFYREQQAVYGTMAQPQIQQPVVRPQAELGYGHVGQLGPVGVDATGRQVYYTTSQGGMGPTTYQPVVASVAAADMRQGPGLTVNQDGKMVVNPNKIP